MNAIPSGSHQAREECPSPAGCSKRSTLPGSHKPGPRKRNALLTVLAGAVVVGVMASCRDASVNTSLPLIEDAQSTSAPTTVTPVETPTIALVMKTLTNPFFIEMERGARRAESELNVQLIVKTAAQETSIEQQISIIESLIQADVDAIVIAPGDSTELIPVLKKAQDAGIVIINIDNRLDVVRSSQLGLMNVPFISVDNEHGAYLAAKYIADQVTTPTQAAILEGIRTAQNALDRKRGAERAFRENPKVTIVASETANWKIDEANQVIRQILASHPDIGLIFCSNDMMALGVLQYLQATGRTDVRVAGFDALEEAKESIQDGTLAVTIDQQAAEQGYLGVHYALRALKEETLPPETMIDVLVVNKDSL